MITNWTTSSQGNEHREPCPTTCENLIIGSILPTYCRVAASILIAGSVHYPGPLCPYLGKCDDGSCAVKFGKGETTMTAKDCTHRCQDGMGCMVPKDSSYIYYPCLLGINDAVSECPRLKSAGGGENA